VFPILGEEGSRRRNYEGGTFLVILKGVWGKILKRGNLILEGRSRSPQLEEDPPSVKQPWLFLSKISGGRGGGNLSLKEFQKKRHNGTFSKKGLHSSGSPIKPWETTLLGGDKKKETAPYNRRGLEGETTACKGGS